MVSVSSYINKVFCVTQYLRVDNVKRSLVVFSYKKKDWWHFLFKFKSLLPEE